MHQTTRDIGLRGDVAFMLECAKLSAELRTEFEDLASQLQDKVVTASDRVRYNALVDRWRCE